MFKNISLGMYYPGNSTLHRLQARTKLLVLLWILVWLVVANQHEWHFAPYIVVGVFACLGVFLSGISPRELWQRMWLLVVLAIIGAVPALFSTQGTVKTLYPLGPLLTSYALMREVLLTGSVVLTVLLLSSLLPLPTLHTIWRQRWLKRVRIPLILATLAAIVFLCLIWNTPPTNTFSIGPLIITYYGVWLLVSFFVTLLVLYVFSLLLTMTTSSVALIEGLTLLLAPLRLLRLPVDDFALMTLLALRFIPTLLEEVEQLSKAQTSRGADVSSGTIRERVQSLAMLFVPLMQDVLRRAAELAIALEARGYEVEGRQTLLYEKPFAMVDYVVLGVVVVVTVGALML